MSVAYSYHVPSRRLFAKWTRHRLNAACGVSRLRPSGKFSWLVIAVTGFLTALLLVVVEAVPQPSTSLLLSNLLQSAIVLWAALCSLLVARRSKAYLRQLWMLLAAALFLGCAAQTLETFYQSVAHAPTLTPWPSDVLSSCGLHPQP